MQAKDNDALLSDVASYYTDKLKTHGETPRGVDWNGEESQALRFKTLSQVFDGASGFSVNDLGCGYGALFEFLIGIGGGYGRFSYLGIDVSEEMVSAARRRHGEHPQARFIVAAEPDEIADYGIASGIFNVRLGHSEPDWHAYIQSTLDILDRTSRRGFAFNCLTSYSDPEKMRDHLHYADPCALFDLCKRRYSRNVALLHDYGLYEFTILVRKAP